ncbi:hypothetical protein KNE206_53310 [Kitasatospora sp. NE20-6]|uniref:DUF317 domain-containing protein n=1 Tax=Kitasatospora sp. NE20-6 TaxID=2859066 RepID=UPI0034DBF69A
MDPVFPADRLSQDASLPDPSDVLSADGEPWLLTERSLDSPLVAVRPAYLAVGSAASTAAARRVLMQAGWPRDRRSGTEVFARDGVEVRLVGTDPLHRDALVAEGPGWQAHFSTGTPDEVLAAAAQALTESTAAAAGDGPDVEEAVRHLSDAGWEAHGDDPVQITAPGEMASVWASRSGKTWRIGVLDGAGWQAALYGALPAPLVEAVAAELASTAAVPRRLGHLPLPLRPHLDISPIRAAAARRTSPGRPRRRTHRAPRHPHLYHHPRPEDALTTTPAHTVVDTDALDSEALSLLTADLEEESEQVQALARSLELPGRGEAAVQSLSTHLLQTFVHLATTAASAAAVVDAYDPLTALRLRTLVRIEAALQALLAATGAMATTLDQVAATGGADATATVQAGRLRAAALLNTAAAHLGAATASLRAS